MPSLYPQGRNIMLRRVTILAVTFVLPAALAAQVPNGNASDTGKAKVAAHRQNPQVPAQEASDTAKSKVSQHRATQIRGSVVGTDNRPVTPATRAVPATRATPSTGGGAATPATPATPAVPASPSKKPASAGQSGSHRP